MRYILAGFVALSISMAASASVARAESEHIVCYTSGVVSSCVQPAAVSFDTVSDWGQFAGDQAFPQRLWYEGTEGRR